MDLSKKSQLAYRKKRKKGVVKVKEASLQKQANDLLDWYHIPYYRIPDFVWNWVRHNAPVEIVRALSESFAGKLPDDFIFTNLTDKYLIALPLEIKTVTGKLHGKQKTYAKRDNWQISRSPEDTIRIVNQFQADAALYTKYLKEVEWWDKMSDVQNAESKTPEKSTNNPSTNSDQK